MRLRLLGVVGALTLAVGACGETVGPPEAAAGRDLEFVAPVGMPAIEPSGFRAWSDSLTPEQVRFSKQHREAALEGSGTMFPIISQWYATAGWNGDQLTALYGMFGGGTGYSMTPWLYIRDATNNVIAQRQGVGRSEDLPLYWYLRPTAEEDFLVGISCGASAELRVLFETRIGPQLWEFTALKAQESKSFITYQQMCAPPPRGSAPTGQQLVVTTCDYEAWYTSDGDLITVYLVGCDTYPTGVYVS